MVSLGSLREWKKGGILLYSSSVLSQEWSWTGTTIGLESEIGGLETLYLNNIHLVGQTP